ncbi:alpha/beta hydrolase family protein [Pseudomonas sp. S75]|uniref:alpha/beta hydrolase family protein n=1 Tax=unclassified Pseudomonas TaxID=196821 RepID=UPI0019071964|nr:MULTISPECIES: alpha/beta hydrolase family protein [unclassified Pseudomonas]MBJ9976952.1 alpha/beta hydrolase family protein [Pseudomonas sp. S30]MBK0154052.1 alpha/beta hydrolase family protein [Pseudomonas sp. S75]
MLLPHRTSLAMLCLAASFPLATRAADPDPAPAAPATEVRAPLLERSQEDALALERRVPKVEQQTLQAEGGDFLALWKPANDTDPKGAVIIVPGAGESADWPDTVGPLRSRFPDVGWHSLSLSLPDLLADTPQPRSDDTPAPASKGDDKGTSAPAKATPDDANANVAQATAADPDTAQTGDTARTSDHNDQADAARIFARLDAAVAFAQQQNAHSIVLIGHGSGAYWAARYVSEKQPPQVQKLALIAAQTPARVEHDLESLVPTLKIPTADIYFVTRTRDQDAAKRRLQASKREKDSQYRQLSLIAMPGDRTAEQEQLFRRVRGWMMPQPAE